MYIYVHIMNTITNLFIMAKNQTSGCHDPAMISVVHLNKPVYTDWNFVSWNCIERWCTVIGLEETLVEL